ncbi:MAG: hypothetical protein U1F66_06810 [bacterium]
MLRTPRPLRFAALCSALVAFSLACTSGKKPDALDFPSIVAIDSTLNRVFVIDNQQNGLNLIDPTTDKAVLFGKNDESLLNNEDPQLLPQFPNNGAVVSLAGGVSRLFVIGGAGATPGNQIVVLDYDDTNLIRNAPFTPISVAGNPSDSLVGIAVAPDLGLVFVSNATSGQVHAYNVNTGAEVANSPIAVGGIPGRMNYDPDSGLLAVSDAANTTVSLIDASNLAGGAQTVDVGVLTRDAALASNANGTVLFVSGSQVNTARVFLLDLSNLANSTEIFQLNPNSPTQPIPDPNFVPGTINFVKAANLSDGRMAGFYTQSTGDLLELDLTNNLSTLTPAITSVGAISGEGLDYLQDGSGNATKVYYASPGVGTLTVVNPLTNAFLVQIP